LIKLPFLAPVVPPHVFCLQLRGVTYARVRFEEPAGFERERGTSGIRAVRSRTGRAGAAAAPREAVAEAVKRRAALSGGRLSRASVVYPDAWARSARSSSRRCLPTGGRTQMVPLEAQEAPAGFPPDLAVVWEPMPELTDEKRVLVAAAPREMIQAIESAFGELGVRVGCLTPATMALFEGLSPMLSAASGGDYALLHRSADGALSFFIARGTRPIFFRHRPSESGDDHEREARLSLSYYAEKLKGPGLSAVYVHDEVPDKELHGVGAFPVPVVPLSARVLQAAPDFDERLGARPELLAGYAAVLGAA
jgi:hypothetical protein